MKQESSEAVLELLLREESVGPAAHNGSASVSIGTFVRFDQVGRPLVEFSSNGSGEVQPARSTVGLDPSQAGSEVVLAFEGGDHSKPIVIGVLRHADTVCPVAPLRGTAAAEVDGERLVLTAAREVVLRCGKTSITLTRTGKVLIRGTYVVSRSSGVNKVNGASIQLN
jgi:hypothetical protein